VIDLMIGVGAIVLAVAGVTVVGFLGVYAYSWLMLPGRDSDDTWLWPK